MPGYQLEPLLQYLPPLEAHELRDLITAATAPHTKPYAHTNLMRNLGRLEAELYPPPPPAPPPVHIEIDRAKAAEWFASQGVKVVRRDEVESA